MPRTVIERQATASCRNLACVAGLALVLAASCGSPAPAAAPASAPAAPEVEAQSPLAPESLMATVRTLTGPDMKGRAAGSPGNALARAWIADRFTDIGLERLGETYLHPFSYTLEDAPTPREGVNVVGRCTGRSPDAPAIVLSAHYDHLGVRNGETYHGADDNASGVAVLLAIAAECRREPFHHPLIVVAFDAEEDGLQGARAFVARPPVPRDRIALDINLDMVSRSDARELFAAGTYHYPELEPALEGVAARAPISLRFGHDRPEDGADDWTTQSDHGPFHAAGVPFVYFGVEDHADYHKPTDTADKIAPAFFADAARTILDAVRALDAAVVP